MPILDLEKRKEYQRLYMREHRQLLTPEQKARKSATSKEWAQRNADKLKEYQRNRQIRDKEKISARKKKYAQEHPEIIQAKSKEYYEKNKEAIKIAVKEYRLKNLEEIKSNSRKYRKTPKGRLQMYKASADKRGYDFFLSTDEFNALLSSNCHYCTKPEAMGVDRKNNSIGYFSYNVVACCKTCNYMKGTLDYQDFISHIKAISSQFD